MRAYGALEREMHASLAEIRAEAALRHLEVVGKLDVIIDAIAELRADFDRHVSDGHGE
jgi:hypothetical protein